MSKRTACLMFAALLLVVLVAGCGGSGGGGSSDPNGSALTLGSTDTEEGLATWDDDEMSDKANLTNPILSSASPAIGAIGVATNVRIAASFSQGMAASSITMETLTLKDGATPVAGSVAYDHRTAVFRPSTDLTPNTIFTVSLTKAITNYGGIALARAYTWNFTTGAGPDTTAPRVTSTTPANDATGIAPNKLIAVTFNEAIDPTTIKGGTFTLKAGTTRIQGIMDYYAGRTATLKPVTTLAANTTYTATLTTAVKDPAFNALASPFVWHFTTGPPADATAPTVTATSPAEAAIGVALKLRVTATFSEAMSPSMMTSEKFSLWLGATRVQGTVTYANRIATFVPLRRLMPCSTYTATVSGTGAKSGAVTDVAGNPLATSYVWQFRTGLETVPLNSAAPFAVLAGSTVTNTALLTTINGDLGVSPGTAIDGFPPGVVNGTIHAGDPVAAQAKLDLTTAYNDAAGRSCYPVAVAGNLGGMTLYPGLYKSTSSLEISSGNLTLDARGNPNAVFIFQMASTLTTTSGRQIILAGDARAANIYWQVGSSATLGSTSVFQGNILADISITLNTGATLNGRALARTGAVTLDGNTINRP